MPGTDSSTKERSKLVSFAQHLAVFCFGGVLALFLLEALLHFYNPFQSRIKGNRIVLVTNRQYHIKNTLIPSLEPVITVTRNSLGFRGPDAPAKLDDYLSIVAIGGSTTQCFFLSDDKTWPAQLAERLKPNFPRLWLNNAGLDGHSSYGHLVLVEDNIRKLHPKVALFLVGGNDIARDPRAEFDTENVKGAISFASPTAFFKSLSPYSEVASLVANGYRSFNAYQHGLLHQRVDLKQQGYFDASPAQEAAYYAESASDQFVSGYRERLERLVDATIRAGIFPVLITQPLLAGGDIDDVTGVDLSRIRASPRINGKMWWIVLERYNDVTRQVGEARKIPVIDLARKLPKSSRYFYDFIHYNGEGAAAISEILSKEMCPILADRFPKWNALGCK